MDWTMELQIVGRVLAASLIGAIVGLEREVMGKPAGLRTHLLVAGACALLVQMGDVMVLHFQGTQNDQILRADPIRIIEAIAAGISFIGAGTIIFDRSRGKLEGITTAAGILMTAGIGIAVGLDAYITAVSLAVLVAVILRGLGALEHKMGWTEDFPGDDVTSDTGSVPPRPHER